MPEIRTGTTSSHNIFTQNRGKIEVTGVADVDSFDDETVILLTQMGELTIKGQNLRVTRFTVETGDLCVEGTLHALAYSGEKSKGGFFSKVFK